jgi:hypothetical protein
MTTTLLSSPAEEAVIIDSQRGACAEFVKFCKEQHLRARSAETFIRVLHNKTWEQEVTRIRSAMRPEVEQLFAPIEKALRDGANCREVMAKLVEALREEC